MRSLDKAKAMALIWANSFGGAGYAYLRVNRSKHDRVGPTFYFQSDGNGIQKHVEKIFYMYFDKLKINGLFIIDDISWLPYIKNAWRNNEWIENNNKETFYKLIEIYNSNQKKN